MRGSYQDLFAGNDNRLGESMRGSYQDSSTANNNRFGGYWKNEIINFLCICNQFIKII